MYQPRARSSGSAGRTFWNARLRSGVCASSTSASFSPVTSASASGVASTGLAVALVAGSCGADGSGGVASTSASVSASISGIGNGTLCDGSDRRARTAESVRLRVRARRRGILDSTSLAERRARSSWSSHPRGSTSADAWRAQRSPSVRTASSSRSTSQASRWVGRKRRVAAAGAPHSGARAQALMLMAVPPSPIRAGNHAGGITSRPSRASIRMLLLRPYCFPRRLLPPGATDPTRAHRV